MFRGLELSIPPQDLQRGEKHRRVNSIANGHDLVNHDYVMKPPQKPRAAHWSFLQRASTLRNQTLLRATMLGPKLHRGR